MAKKNSSAGSTAGHGRGGNVVVDLGEEIDALIQGKKGLGAHGSKASWQSRFGGGGSLGYGKPGVHRSQLGMAIDMPAAVDPVQLLGGTLIGAGVNRILYRAIPAIAGGRITSELLVNGISAGIGVLPYFLARKNSFAVGFAIPGLLTLVNSLFDAVLNAVRILPKPALTGAAPVMPSLASVRPTIDGIRQRFGAQRPTVSSPQIHGTRLAPAPIRVAVAS